MQIDPETLVKWLNFALTVLVGAYTFFATRRQDVDERFKEGSKRMDAQDRRLALLDQKVQALPEKEDLHHVQLELAKLTGNIGQVSALLESNRETMARQEKTLNRLEDFLMNGGQ